MSKNIMNRPKKFIKYPKTNLSYIESYNSIFPVTQVLNPDLNIPKYILLFHSKYGYVHDTNTNHNYFQHSVAKDAS